METVLTVSIGATDPVFRLDEERHKAFLGEREIVRATSVFTTLGLVNPEWFTPEGRDRGLLLHDAVYAWHQAISPIIPAHVKPYWNGFLRFMEESDFAIWRAEEPIYDDTPGYEYGGRYDLVGRLGAKWASDYDDLIDLKTGSMPATVKWQTAGYGRKVPVPPMRLRRWALVLPGNDAYRLEPLNLTPDRRRVDVQLQRLHERDFLSMVRVANLKLGLCRG